MHLLFDVYKYNMLSVKCQSLVISSYSLLILYGISKPPKFLQMSPIQWCTSQLCPPPVATAIQQLSPLLAIPQSEVETADQPTTRDPSLMAHQGAPTYWSTFCDFSPMCDGWSLLLQSLAIWHLQPVPYPFQTPLLWFPDHNSHQSNLTICFIYCKWSPAPLDLSGNPTGHSTTLSRPNSTWPHMFSSGTVRNLQNEVQPAV